MTPRRIQTEEPVLEQWRWLSRYSYEPNITRYFAARSAPPPSSELGEYITGCIRQGHAYFNAAAVAPLDIQPLLLYYGATNLASGAAAMLSGSRLPIAGHGMHLRVPTGGAKRIADLEVVPVSPSSGAIQLLASTFATGMAFPSGVPWTVEEILGSIPDLKQPFVECFPKAATFALPVEQLRHDGIALERIRLSEFGSGVDPLTILMQVPAFRTAYISPEIPASSDCVILRRKLGGKEIGTYSIMGSKWLLIGHEKGGKLVEPGQLVLMLMGLFALGHVSRYCPELWNPFVRTDQTGERLVVERFLLNCLRYVPNLVLNGLEGDRLQFVLARADAAFHEMPTTDDELKRLIRREVTAYIKEHQA